MTISQNVSDIISNLENAGLDASAIKAQVFPSDAEKIFSEVELTDPLGAESHSVTPHLIHQYKNRCLLLTTLKCFGFCRYCFRKNLTESVNDRENCSEKSSVGCDISSSELDEICGYLKKHDEIQEILFSGGDPLMLSDEKLFALIDRIRASRPGILIRICTRALFFAPSRFTPSLIAKLRSYKPLWIIPHINCSYEIDEKFAPETFSAIERILDSGIPMQSQTVLLRGVNDSVSELSLLFENLARLGIKPGYLFQTDLAKGTAHFRVPVDEAVKIYSDLRNELSGLSLPVFAVDLPGGGGKFNLLQLPGADNGCQKIKALENCYEFTKASGTFKYPR